MELTDIKLFSPEIALIIGSIFILLYGIFFKDNADSNKNILYISLTSLLISFKILVFLSITRLYLHTFDKDQYIK